MNRRHPGCHTFITCVLFLSLCGGVNANPPEKLRLIGADRLEQTTRNDITVKKLTGNVHFRKGAVDLYCDLAYWFEKDERADFYRNVNVTKEDQTLEADTLVYFSADEIIIANGNTSFTDGKITLNARQLKHYVEDDISEARGAVHLQGETRDLRADYVIYYSESEKAVALYNAVLNDPGRNTSLYGDSLVYFSRTENIEANKNPYVVKLDSTGAENFRIRGDIIRGYEDRGRFISIGNVRIWRDDFSAYSDELDYNDSLEIADMLGNPKVFRDGQDLSGDRMKLQLKDEMLQSLFIYNNAVASSRGKAYLPAAGADSSTKSHGDSLRVYDEITGEFMEIYFKDGKTDSIRVSGMATSYYNVTEDSVIQGVNIASGDTVVMNFADKRLQLITVIGGTEGQFIPDKTNKSTDTTVIYSAERIDYHLNDKITFLRDNSSIESGDMKLTAGKIQIQWNDNLLFAYPLGSAPGDSLPGDLPTLYQTGREPFSGEEMIYNMKTKKGRIIEGKTKEEDGYYYGENIAKVNAKEFYVSNGVYTTCDIEDHPHYHFQSKKMKLIHKDKIVARPIVFYIQDIPLLALPFGIFPNQGGRRHSGWLMPTYGESSRDGGNIRGLGYFWAPSDYYDLKLTMDFYDRVGIVTKYATRYKKRYAFSGSINGKYTNEFLSDYEKTEWTLNVRHSHTLSPTMKFNGSGTFVSSDDLYQRMSYNQSDRLKQQLISNATLSKTWPGKPYSMSMTLNQTINLQARNMIKEIPSGSGRKISYISRSLPNVSFSRSSKPIIPLKSGASSKWYNNIYFSLSSKLRNNQTISYLSEVIDDSLQWQKNDVTRSAITHNISMNSSQKVLKFVTLNQNMSIQEGWIMDYDMPVRDSSGAFIIQNNKILTTPVTDFKARHTGSVSMNAQTKLYGMFPIRIGALQVIRHVMTPRVGLSYRPDFTEKIFGWEPGYIETGVDTLGNEWRYDPFRNTLLGGTPSGESRSMTFSLSNIFQAKTKRGDEEKKLDLFTMNFSTSHNFAADSLRWSPISTSIRTKLTKKVALNFSATHDLYKYQNGRKNEWNDEWKGVPIPRLTNVSASTGFSFSGHRFGVVGLNDDQPDTTGIDDELLGVADIDAERPERPMPSGGNKGAELWTASLSLRYSLSQSNPAIKSESFFMTANVKLNLSSKWRVSWNSSIDLIDKSIVSQRFQITRDLHCWELSFSWTPSKYSYASQYNLKINVKSPTLRDLKYEERGGRSSGFGY